MTAHKYLSAAALFFALFLSGCSALQQYATAQKPTAAITGVSIGDISLKTITLNTLVRLDNPNAFNLNAAGLSLDMAVAGHSLANIAQTNNALSLPANGSTQITLPITLAFSDLYKAVVSLKDKNEVPYNLTGKVNLTLPVLGNISLPLSYSDILPIPRLPQIELKDVTLLSASLTQVQIQMDMAVSNPNAFVVNMKSLGYQLAANNKSLSQGNLNAIKLNQGDSQSVSVPVTLNLSQLGMEFFSLLTSNKPLDFQLTGVANLVPELGIWKPEPLSFSSKKRLEL